MVLSISSRNFDSSLRFTKEESILSSQNTSAVPDFAVMIDSWSDLASVLERIADKRSELGYGGQVTDGIRVFARACRSLDSSDRRLLVVNLVKTFSSQSTIDGP